MAKSSLILRRVVVLFLLLAAAWLLWSGLFKPLLLALGLFSCVLTIYVTRRMGYFSTDVFALRFGGRLFTYWFWLAKEIVKSSLDVARIILTPGLPISPTVVKIRPHCSHPVDQVILANSITLTPGTLALDVHNDEITVHALTKTGAEDVANGEMDRRVSGLRRD